MDWKDYLAGKISDGTLEREEFTEPEEAEKCDTSKSGVLKVVTDRKGRKGKTATIIEGFTCPIAELNEIAARIKTSLGAGGSVREGEILIQGDVAERVRQILKSLGYNVK